MIYEIINIGRLPHNTPKDDERIGQVVEPILQIGFPGYMKRRDGSELKTSRIKQITVVGKCIYFETQNTEYTLEARGLE